jgi:hypothetical protein
VNWNGKPRAAFYSANYINWYRGGGTGSRTTRCRSSSRSRPYMIAQLNDVNLGLARYSNNEGSAGMNTKPRAA